MSKMFRKVKEGKEKLKEKFSKKKDTSSQSLPLAGASATTTLPSSSWDTGLNTGLSTWNGVLSLLSIAEKTLDSVPVPGLKSAISGFLEVVNQLKQVSGNADAISQLENSVKFFNRSVSEPLEQYKGKGAVPPELAQAIDALSANLDEVISPLKSHQGQSRVQRWADRNKIGGDVQEAGEGIRDAVRAFQVSFLHDV
ncbi:uncharacterized protein EI90DRAFT_3293277 [Cantharellus anzutake]|uniref:uncharacterized protein n=1 Tax=Cantharellus anzutake TaxID=1750568 RepID=UPI001904F965|nr:uncharacterized protein EI90DRAFT_3294466 [Cantharellus anzutake]XP_038909697.1 uncharacterized protein EI90DRAFT_3293277 [Cantharellus anzutake]KAF8313536.1 hypothetical protein EI90DRAFT_3294466 [Cantharellus anzutake]KAF8318328.1 hypothetical protein EI90DRAFT_3293277 [Cantharellus anzutake]